MTDEAQIISTNIDDHLHCLNCFFSECSYEKCLLIRCTSCSISLHPCKLEDHLSICPKTPVPCINTLFGCKKRLLREKMSEHLRVCTASVVHCGMQWNRQLLNKAAKKHFKKIVKGFESEPSCEMTEKDLDVISALQDQNEIRLAYRVKREVRRQQRNYFTPVNPLLPLRLAEEAEGFEEVDSSEDELKKNEAELKKKKSPFDDCYLCKMEPGFQHLHVLGCMSAFRTVDSKTEEAPKPTSIMDALQPYYKNYGLFVDRFVHFINAYHPKGFIYDWVREMHTFVCGSVVRREEFSLHHEYHSHLHQLLDSDLCVRCPLWEKGCPYVCSRLKPKTGQIRFNAHLKSFVNVPVPSDSLKVLETDFDHASTILIWKLVLPYLDSASLKCLSVTSSLFRRLIQNLCYDQSTVNIIWTPIKKEDGKNRWIIAGYRRDFSTVQSQIEWIVDPIGELSDHLKKCPYNIVREFKEEKISLKERHGIETEKPETLRTKNNLRNVINVRHD